MNRLLIPALVALGTLAGLVPSRSAVGQAPRRDVWAVVIGIDNYEDITIPPCRGSLRDSRAVSEWLIRTAGWGDQNVLRMDDTGRPTHGAPSARIADLKPTLKNLDWAIVEWLGARVKRDDVVVIYFAGQATSRAALRGAPAGRVFLLPIDATAGDVPRTGWSLDDTLDKAKTLAEKQPKIVILLDTSPIGRGEKGLPVEKGATTGQDWLRALTRWPGVTAWLSTDGRLAAEAGSPGPFVAPLLKAMGTVDESHNLLGCLKTLQDDRGLVARGFRTLGGVGPSVSLWSGRTVEDVVPELIVQAGHGDRVTTVLVSADNARMITASQDSTVKVWGMADRSLLRVLTDPIVGVEALAIDRDNTTLVAGDGVGRLIAWDMTLDRPRPFVGPPEHGNRITAIAFLPGRKAFVSLDKGRRSMLWDGAGGGMRKIGPLSELPLSRLAAASTPAPGAPALVAAVEPSEGGPGTLLAFDAAGKRFKLLEGPGGRISALDLSADGRRLAVGDDKGRVVVLDLPGGAVAFDTQLEGTIRLVRLSKGGTILVADDAALRLVEPKIGGFSVVLADPKGEPAPGGIDRSAFSDDGRWLAACTNDDSARLLAWRVLDPSKPEALTLPGSEASQALSPGFTPDGRTLVVGDVNGGLRSWSLDDGAGALKAEQRPSIAPARGKVASLVTSPSGRALLEITKDDLALTWDFPEGRGCKPLPGAWTSGAFLPDESKLALTAHPNRGGDVVLFDRVKGEVLPTRFERPTDADGKPSTAVFGPVVVSKSGKWVASAALAVEAPLACVWRVDDGKLVHVARDHAGGITAIDMSGDEEYLLTASDDGSAKLWPMADPAIDLHSASAQFFNRANEAPRITAARVCPNVPGRVVAGTRGGYVFLWKWDKAAGVKPPTLLGQVGGEVNSVTISPDGSWVAASGSLDKTIRFWEIPATGPPRAVRFRSILKDPNDSRPHHAEQVGSLVAWPNGTMIVSGGDDTAIRFWNLKDHALIGTLVAQAREGAGELKPNNLPKVDWLAYTPEGLFDGSLPGEAMVKWRVGDKIVTLQQSEDTHHVFQLATAFGSAERPERPAITDEAPRLKIDTPPADRTVLARDVELTVWSGEVPPTSLRLYQNGVPVRGDGDFAPTERPNFWTTKVTLISGLNRFYFMASKKGAIDGRSDELALRYEGPDLPGRVHTLAIGISDYAKRPLKYAHIDAQRIAQFLRGQNNAPNQKPGEQIVLIDKDVNLDNIKDAFRRLTDIVRRKPEDTVVLFLAGHTDTDTEKEQFCLLLPDFQFNGAPPVEQQVASRGSASVLTRGNVNVGSFRTRVGDENVLAYVMLYNRLSNLDALQRLVIVDACQAGAILDDPAVQNLQRLVDRGSRKARNSYLLAARRGEPANEADALRHGLLTYTILHGMGATGLEPIPIELGGFPGRPSADLNADETVTSDELVTYANEALPRLAEMFPKLVMRAGNAPLKPAPPEIGSPELEKKLKVRSTESSFSLISLPKKP